MVCCSVLATCVANGLSLSKKRIAEISILGERYVGVESGGSVVPPFFSTAAAVLLTPRV